MIPSNKTPLDEIEKWHREGKITETQYKRLKKDYLVEEKGGYRYAQKILIGTGFLILAIAIFFFIFQAWREFSFETRIFILFISGFPLIFFGYFLWNRSAYLRLSRGFLCLGIFLIFLGFAYIGWDGDRNVRVAVGIILFMIPFAGLLSGILKNSESVAVVSLLIFVWGLSCAWTFLEIKYSILDFSNYTVEILILFATFVNICWRFGIFKKSLFWYKEHEDAIKSLWLTGIILLIPWIYFHPELGPTYNRSIILIFVGFLCVFYAIMTDYRGLLKTGCIILIISSWISGIGWGVAGISFASFFTGLILIGLGQGLSYLTKKSLGKRKN